MAYKRPPIPESAKRINREYDKLVDEEIIRFNNKLDRLTELRVKELMANSKKINDRKKK